MRLIFTASKTYSETTPESASAGDFSDTGFIDESSDYTFKELIHELSDYSELSSWPVSSPRQCHYGIWVSTDWHTVCYQTGTERQESIHIEKINGKKIKPHQLYRIFKAAGLIKTN